MTHETYSDEDIAHILSSIRNIALVGASANPVRASFIVMKYLAAKGYSVDPVNPGLAGQTLLGRKVYASLADIEGGIDMVDIFRNSQAALGVVREAITLKGRLGLKVIWMQLGVRNDQAAAEAEAAGLKVVMNRCPKIEYGRLSGEIGWFGINTGRVSSRLPRLSPAGVQSLRIEPQEKS
ncbi:MAG TPA: CoA-binding protein [Hyphomicrobium sp.]|nr:CoA-binding protein [Hyphomicrobium sp.]